MEKLHSKHRGVPVFQLVEQQANGEEVLLGFCFHDPVTGMRIKAVDLAEALAELDKLLDEDSIFR